ncbi:hypothetical protein [Phormidium tenue]|uniref:Uncharacterized protein n=1 Tax=Phormidium tenue FACHB-1050 TaxID=2692857 RepID=A0ABR8C539_9CYAN|nr:hypothetical protein [Phormidium tenue]MBD2315822.1 hypothetical protein [Phormidium tenue FACHB-1050]
MKVIANQTNCFHYHLFLKNNQIAPCFNSQNSDRLFIKNKTRRSPHHATHKTAIAYSLKFKIRLSPY